MAQEETKVPPTPAGEGKRKSKSPKPSQSYKHSKIAPKIPNPAIKKKNSIFLSKILCTNSLPTTHNL
jgi:hypothetical protein